MEMEEDGAVQTQQQVVDVGELTHHSAEDEGESIGGDMDVEGDSTPVQMQQQHPESVEMGRSEEDEGDRIEEEDGVESTHVDVEGDSAAIQLQQGDERMFYGQVEDETESVERMFYGQVVPSWRDQLTVRALAVSFMISVLFSFVLMKLSLTTAVIPSLNVAAGLLGFFLIKTWTKVLLKTGLLCTPFTRQENTVIQTCVVAASGMVFSRGFGNNILAMSSRVASQIGETNFLNDIKEPRLGWMIGFLFIVSLVGPFSLVLLRKIMIIDYKMIYPSGTAVGHLINGFHTPRGAKLAKKQVKKLGHFFVYSFLWGFFRWFYNGGDNCGFSSFPILGLRAFRQRFYFDFSPTYVGVGMISPHIVNASVLFGGILSWGIMWPLIQNQKGNWYSTNFPESSLRSLTGYKAFIAIALILGDGIYNFGKVLHRKISAFVAASRRGTTSTLPATHDDHPITTPVIPFDDERRANFFLKDQIPKPIALGGYVVIVVISIATIPRIFPSLKWYYILVAYTFAPMLAFCNAYGCGLTNWSLATTYARLVIFFFGAWAGPYHGRLLTGLVVCGVMMNIVSSASDLMQDFKTGYLTLASPRAMFISQVIGTAMGCVISPCVFWLFYNSFKDVGLEGSEYPAPYGVIYRDMAIIGAEGVHSLPKHCLTLCFIFFVIAIIINLIKDLVPKKVSKFIPIPMAMAIPFNLGSYFAIDTLLGSCILLVWERVNKTHAEKFSSAVAAGMICGDGIWTLPQSILALAKISPPICMKFISRAANVKVDNFLATVG